MYTDPIADYHNRVRNAVRANHRVVETCIKFKRTLLKYYSIKDILSYKFVFKKYKNH